LASILESHNLPSGCCLTSDVEVNSTPCHGHLFLLNVLLIELNKFCWADLLPVDATALYDSIIYASFSALVFAAPLSALSKSYLSIVF